MRELAVEDAPIIGDLLARAFVEDPPVVWGFPDPADRVEGMRAVFTANARLALAGGQGVMTDGGGAAGLFIPAGVELGPEAVTASGLQAALDALEPDIGAKLARFLGTLTSLEAETMGEPHWSLAFLASAPEARGSGQAARVIEEFHRRADATGHPCFLDTLTEWNVAYYERRGYRVIGEARVPDSPLTAWAMRRDPASS